MNKVTDVFNPDSEYAKLPYDESVITKFATWGSVAIYGLTICATVMFMLVETRLAGALSSYRVNSISRACFR